MDQMRLVGFAQANTFAIIILLLIYFSARKYSYKYAYEQRLYTFMIFSNISMLIIDIVRMYVNEKSGLFMYGTNFLFTTIMYGLTPILSMLWTIYVDYRIFMDKARLKRRFKYTCILAIINVVIVIISVLGGIKGNSIFHIDENNIYSRGSLYKVTVLISFAYIIYSLIFIKKNKKIIDDFEYKSLCLFALPPFIGAFLQATIYGLKLTWIAMALSMLIIFLYVQNDLLHVDVLTGLYNRRNLEKYLNNIFNLNNKSRIIGGVLLDINDFKYINDTYGHDEGDRALISVANILNQGFDKEDFISRYAGDEFIVICKLKSCSELNNKIENLKEIIDEFNESSESLYKISMSIGYDMFTSNSGITEEKFIKKIDSLMYEDKKRYKQHKRSRINATNA